MITIKRMMRSSGTPSEPNMGFLLLGRSKA
jgi:hypothetical protein